MLIGATVLGSIRTDDGGVNMAGIAQGGIPAQGLNKAQKVPHMSNSLTGPHT